MEKNSEESRNTFHITEGVLLGILSAIAYLYVYLNEYWYSRYFNIPSNYIRISLEQILLNSFYMIFFSFMIFFAFVYANFFFDAPKRRWIQRPYAKIYSKRTAKDTIYASLALFLILKVADIVEFSNPSINTFLYIGIIILFMVIFTVIVTVKANHLAQNIENEIDEGQSNFEISIFTNILRLNYSDLLLIIAILIGILLYSSLDGYESAKNGKSYYVVNTNPEMVILKSYGETLISAPFDRETNTVEKKFTIVEVKEELGLFASYERLGRLKPIEISVPVEEPEEIQEGQEPPE